MSVSKLFTKSQIKLSIIELTQEKKPFACQVCDRKFALKGDLVRHQATYSEVRSFKSSICQEG